MAGDTVEVLREMWSRLLTNQVIRPDPSWRTALAEALAVLEAERHSRRWGRMTDSRANKLAHEAIRIEDASLDPYEAAVFREIRKDWAGRRASEATLSERVATLTGRIREAIKICDANTQSQLAARIYDVLRHGFTHDAAPPSKPETP